MAKRIREQRDACGNLVKRSTTAEEKKQARDLLAGLAKQLGDLPDGTGEFLGEYLASIPDPQVAFDDEFWRQPVNAAIGSIIDECRSHPRHGCEDSWATETENRAVKVQAILTSRGLQSDTQLSRLIRLGMALERMRSKEIHQSKGSRPPTIAKMQRDVAECDRIIARYIQKAGVTKEVAWRHCWETDEKPRRDKTLPPLPISKRSYQEYKKKLKIGAASEQLH